MTQTVFRPPVTAALGLAVWCSLGLLPVSAGAVTCSPTFAWQSAVPGVSVVHGQWPPATSGGRAHAATTVVLGQGAQVTVVDPGPTERVGEALQRDLRCRNQHQVNRLINTHAHAEQVLANSAFKVPAAATRSTRDAMRQRCPDCLAALRHDLGNAALQGTRIVWPTQVLQDGQMLQAGGRRWQVRDMRHAHTESDLVLWSAEDGIALVGGLVDGEHLPVLGQGSVQGWLQALAEVQAWQPRWLVGQHLVSGPGQVPAALQRQRQYLCSLVTYAWQGLEKGLSEAEALQGLQTPGNWVTPVQDVQAPLNAPATHERQAQHQQHTFNQSRAWREVELSWMDLSSQPQPWPGLCASAPVGSTPDVGR